MAEPGFEPFSNAVFELLPILPVVTDLLAVRANREQPPQSLDACQRFFQLGSARSQASLRPDGAHSHLESGTQLFAAKGSSGSKPQPGPPFAESVASRRHSPTSFIGGFPFPLNSGSCEWGLREGTNRDFQRVLSIGRSRPEVPWGRETRNLLGFTHFCGRLNSSRAFIVWRITAKKRMVAKLKAIKAELQRRKHHRTTEVGAWLRKVVLGYYQYHGVPGNSTQLRIFSRRVGRLWRSVLVRRSQRAQVRWGRLSPLLKQWIPQPRILHPYPDARFAATHPQ